MDNSGSSKNKVLIDFLNSEDKSEKSTHFTENKG